MLEKKGLFGKFERESLVFTLSQSGSNNRFPLSFVLSQVDEGISVIRAQELLIVTERWRRLLSQSTKVEVAGFRSLL